MAAAPALLNLRYTAAARAPPARCALRLPAAAPARGASCAVRVPRAALRRCAPRRKAVAPRAGGVYPPAGEADSTRPDDCAASDGADGRANFLDALVTSLLRGAGRDAPGAPPEASGLGATWLESAPLAGARANVLRLLGALPSGKEDNAMASLRLAVAAAPAPLRQLPPRSPPFLAVVASRAALRAAAAWLTLHARRTRHSLLTVRAVQLADRAAALALLRAPSAAAQLAQLAALPAERAAGMLSTLELPDRQRLLDALDATARGAQLSIVRPKAAAAELARIALRSRAAVVEAMPRVAAAAAMRAMDAAQRLETLQALGREARVALSAVMRVCG